MPNKVGKQFLNTLELNFIDGPQELREQDENTQSPSAQSPRGASHTHALFLPSTVHVRTAAATSPLCGWEPLLQSLKCGMLFV